MTCEHGHPAWQIDSSLPKAAKPSIGAIAPMPRRSMRARPARAAIPALSHAPQSRLRVLMPCAKYQLCSICMSL